MQLNSCLQLAFTRPTANAVYENVIPKVDVAIDDLPFLADDSPTPLQTPEMELVQGSVYSAIQCIASDWAAKSQTNFYIPDEYYPGYSYLFDDEGHSEMSIFEKNNRSPRRTVSHSTTRHPAFVYAEEPNNLHPHHYFSPAHIMPHNTISMAKVSTINLIHSHLLPHAPPVLVLQTADNNPMTVPYIHPRLEMPVPPLYLPWYFGALCWSFSFGGCVLLCFPQKWALCGGGCSGSKEFRRHWFPYRTFLWALVIFQGPCSFLADYKNMINISQWHVIDRILACALMSLELVKLFVIRPYTRPLVYLAYLASCAGAVFCFTSSQNSQETLDADGFVFWHCGWHCYPIVSIVVYWIENVLDQRWGEYYAYGCRTEEEMNKCDKYVRRGSLLSTIVMKFWDFMEGTPTKYQLLDASNNDTKSNGAEQVQHSPKLKSAFRCGAIAAPGADSIVLPRLRRSRRIARLRPDI